MNSTSTSPAGIGGINIVFAVVTLFLCSSLYLCISSGSLLLSYCQGESLIQGELVQKIQEVGGVKGIHKIEFSCGKDNKNYFYQCFSTPFSDPLGSSLYLCITKEGILLRELVLHHAFIFFGSLFFSLVLLVLFVLVGVGMCSEQSAYTSLCVRKYVKLFLIRAVMLTLSVVGLFLVMKRIQTDFLFPEYKMVVSSVKCEKYGGFRVGAYSPANGLKYEADWQPTANQATPATGQDIKIVLPPNSEPKYARFSSGKTYSVVLLCIALMSAVFTFVALIKMVGNKG